MPLDHSRGCVNFRDVQVSLSLLTDGALPLPPGRLLRGGKLDAVQDLADIDAPRTVINLRGGPDPSARWPALRWVHLPRPNDQSAYDTAARPVRRWLNAVAGAVAEGQAPFLLHCTSGKDRTGVAVAMLLQVLGVERRLIVEEYLLSDGEVRREWIERALDGIGPDAEAYLDRVSISAVRAALQR